MSTTTLIYTNNCISKLWKLFAQSYYSSQDITSVLEFLFVFMSSDTSCPPSIFFGEQQQLYVDFLVEFLRFAVTNIEFHLSILASTSSDEGGDIDTDGEKVYVSQVHYFVSKNYALTCGYASRVVMLLNDILRSPEEYQVNVSQYEESISNYG